jgi:2'-phosphotransferase
MASRASPCWTPGSADSSGQKRRGFEPYRQGPPSGGAKGSAGKGGKGAGRSSTERFSRHLTRVLRHSAVEDGIPIDPAGWVEVDVLLARPEFAGLTMGLVEQIVRECAKQRYALRTADDGKAYIRANQGHSLGVPDLDLVPITSAADAPIVVHGTYYSAWTAIQKEGLKRMNRQHIHFAIGRPGQNGVISGMRTSAQVLIYLNVARCLKDNVSLLRSANNVILCPGGPDNGPLPPSYFQWAEDARTGQLLCGTREG